MECICVLAAVPARAAEDALGALSYALSSRDLVLPRGARGLFLRARVGTWRMHSPGDWLCEQTFKPFADALTRDGLAVGEPVGGERFARVFVLPSRQRDESRALYARALDHVSDDGIVLAAVANTEGARSNEDDLGRLSGGVSTLSKHKCRVFWSSPGATIDHALAAAWSKLDAPRAIADGGFISRPGLFAWDRTDPASRLLLSRLPTSLRGRVADLGAGYGFLACAALQACPGISSIDLYEAEARALEPARRNLARAVGTREDVVGEVIWHDVTTGLPRRYDAIISNPPFHLGRADQPELGRGFIAAAARALEADGSLWLVANRHLPYEAALAALFTDVRTDIAQDGFKVIRASGVRR